MKCTGDFYLDKNTDLCGRCEDICNPHRPSTWTQCQLDCSGYLLRRDATTISSSHVPSSASSSEIHIIAIVAVIVACGIIMIAAALLLNFLRRQKNGDIASSQMEVMSLKNSHDSDVVMSLKNSHQLSDSDVEFSAQTRATTLISSSSLCDFFQTSPHLETSEKNIYPTHVSSSPSLKSSWQETQQSASMPFDPDPEGQVIKGGPMESKDDQKQLHSVDTVDLQEDFDEVEQALPNIVEATGTRGLDSNSAKDQLNQKITSILQRLPWVEQFWWDADGAKISVSAAQQRQARDDIRSIMRRHQIASGDFTFELVSPFVGQFTWL